MDFIFRNLGLSKEQQSLIIRSAWVVLVSGHILWACGWLAFLGVPSPFAWAGDVKTVDNAIKIIAEQIQEDRLERIEHDILIVKTSFCKATNLEAKQQYAQRVSELVDRYYRTAQRNPRIPTCDEV